MYDPTYTELVFRYDFFDSDDIRNGYALELLRKGGKLLQERPDKMIYQYETAKVYSFTKSQYSPDVYEIIVFDDGRIIHNWIESESLDIDDLYPLFKEA